MPDLGSTGYSRVGPFENAAQVRAYQGAGASSGFFAIVDA